MATTTLTRALIKDAQLSLWLNERRRSLPGLSYWALCRSICVAREQTFELPLVVIPCYSEEHRIDVKSLVALAWG